MSRNVDRGAATRDQLVAAATRLFAERGYEHTSIEAVLRETGVSRGALYHHFNGKDALFQAVLEAIYVDIGRRGAAAAAGAGDPVEALRAGCLAWIEIASDPVVQRVLLLDAPSVLGWQRWRELDERHALGMIKVALGAAAESGRLPAGHVDLFAHILLASLNEVALVIARADDPEAATQAATAAVEELLDRLLGPSARTSG